MWRKETKMPLDMTVYVLQTFYTSEPDGGGGKGCVVCLCVVVGKGGTAEQGS